MTRELEWTRASSRHWVAADGPLDYDARLVKGAWRVRMKGVPVGPKEGFPSFEAARDYVDWGDAPCRVGHDRETGEVQ